MTVYMVTTGEYSDYRVRGIFSTREKAQAFIESDRASYYGGSDHEIDERELDEYDSQEIVEVHHWFTDSTGRSTTEPRSSSMWKPKGWRGEAKFDENMKFQRPTYWHCSAESAVSAEHAKKLVIEKLQEVQRQQALTK